MRSGVEIEQVLTQNIKKNKTLIQVIQNSISIRKTFPFPDLFRGVTRLFCGIFHSCFGIIVSRFGRFRSCFGVIHLFRRNFLSFQRIIHLFRGVTRLFRGIFHSCFGIIVSRFGRFRSCFGVIHLFRRNFLSFQRIIHLFRGIFHSHRGIKLSRCGRFLSLCEIKPTLFGVYPSNPINQFGFKTIKTLIYG